MSGSEQKHIVVFQPYSHDRPMSSTYHAERKLLQIRNGKLHCEIWRLGKESETEDQVFRLKTELHENTVRIRTLNYLIKNDTDEKVNDTTSDNAEDRHNNHI